VLNNQPQGGFITRKPTVQVASQPPQRDNGFSPFSFFQRNAPPPVAGNTRRRREPYYQQQQQQQQQWQQPWW
jgi:hypothetical protein